jgi:hypothetical protein
VANALNEDVTGRLVVVKAKSVTPGKQALTGRIFQVDARNGGFGAVPYTSGRAVFGWWLDNGRRGRVEGPNLERLITREEAAQAFTEAGAAPCWEASPEVTLVNDR